MHLLVFNIGFRLATQAKEIKGSLCSNPIGSPYRKSSSILKTGKYSLGIAIQRNSKNDLPDHGHPYTFRVPPLGEMAEWFKAAVLPRDFAKAKNVVAFPASGITRKTGRNAMYFVYVLVGIDTGRLYVGSSASPDQRLDSHNAGRVKSTKAFRPWKRVLLEEYSDRATAEKRERYLKSGWGRRWLKENIRRDG